MSNVASHDSRVEVAGAGAGAVKARVNINYQISLKDKINNKTNISEPPEEKLDNYFKTNFFRPGIQLSRRCNTAN